MGATQTISSLVTSIRHVSMGHKQLSLIFTLSCFLNYVTAQVGYIANFTTGPCVDDSASMVVTNKSLLIHFLMSS